MGAPGFKVEWDGSPNFSQGRSGRTPLAIVNHITDGLFPGCLSWLQNTASQVSAHYLVTKTGRVIQMVKDEDTAWANGKVNRPDWPLYDGSNPNSYTISIEHEGLSGEVLTEDQYQATLWLQGSLVDKWKIPVDKDHIIGHYRIDSVDRPDCPGPGYPWERLFSDLEGRNKTVTERWKLDIIEEAMSAELITMDHDPDEKASVWFVLAVCLNLLKEVKEMLGAAGAKKS